MRQAHWVYSCDWCGHSETTDTQSMPEDWLLVLVGDDRKQNKWQSRRHICGACWGTDSTLLNPQGVHDADKD